MQGLNAQPPDLMQIAKVTEIHFAEAEFVQAAARCLAQLMEISADMAASFKARIDAAVDVSMQDHLYHKQPRVCKIGSVLQIGGRLPTANHQLHQSFVKNLSKHLRSSLS